MIVREEPTINPAKHRLQGDDLVRFDLVIVNAQVHTLRKRGETATAVGVIGGRIARVGNTAEIKQGITPTTKVINAGGRVVLPGFVDAHTHFAIMGVRETQLSLREAGSKVDVLRAVTEHAAARGKGEWVIGTDWDESRWSDDKTYLTKDELDRAAPENPVALRRIDGHLWSVNSRALERVKIGSDTIGYEEADAGILKEHAGDRLAEVIAPDVDGYVTGIATAVRKAHSLGVTSVHDAYVDGTRIKAYRRLHESNGLNVRVTMLPGVEYLDEMIDIGLGQGFGDERLRLGPVKILADGSIGAMSAAVSDGYRDAPNNTGVLTWDEERLRETVAKAHLNDIQLAIHAIGDRAIGLVLDALEQAGAAAKGLRHRIEHFEMPTSEHIAQMARLGVVASMQPNFVGEWGLPGGMYENRLGRERAVEMNPFARLVAAGVPLAFGSDCMPFGPLYGVHWAVNAPHPGQRISPEEAFRAYTYGGAYAEHAEGEKGTIAPGLLADLVILDGDPFHDPRRINEMGVAATVFDGKLVYQTDEVTIT